MNTRINTGNKRNNACVVSSSANHARWKGEKIEKRVFFNIVYIYHIILSKISFKAFTFAFIVIYSKLHLTYVIQHTQLVETILYNIEHRLVIIIHNDII